MSEGTLSPSTDTIGVSVFDVEYTLSTHTNTKRNSVKISDFPRIATLRTLFSAVRLIEVKAEARQDSDVGDEEGKLVLKGHIYLAIIPTCKDTDAATGASASIVNNVPNKQTMPLSSSCQANEIFSFNLKGYETDLAQDPRRGAGPVVWIGNSGVTNPAGVKLASPLVTVTWRVKVECSGSTPLWQ